MAITVLDATKLSLKSVDTAGLREIEGMKVVFIEECVLENSALHDTATLIHLADEQGRNITLSVVSGILQFVDPDAE